jgi:MoaA/NifB/PqqE/SkfB family radical SAM enzyme
VVFTLQRVKALYNAVHDYGVLYACKKVETKLLGGNTSTYCYNYPTHVILETTNRCNLSCIWCPRYFRPVTDDMPLTRFRRIVESIGYVENLAPLGFGEPLLHKDFDACINLASDHSAHTNINTNGLLLNRVNIERLNSSGLSELIVSLNGSTPDGCRLISSGGDFEAVFDNLRLYSEIGEKPLRIFSVIGEPNLKSVENLPELAKSLGVKSLEFNIVHPPPGLYHLLPDPDQLKRTLALLKDKCGRLGVKTNTDVFLAPQPTSSCFAPFFDCFIDSEGYMGPCCNYPQMRFGNVLSEGFSGAWNGGAFRRFRGDIRRGRFDGWCAAFCIKFRDAVNQMGENGP